MASRRGIPTIYKGLLFRSRLEAQWAHFFDQLQWPWQYEPIDLDGYIPDFVLPFDAGPLLVEVKPEFYLADLEQHTAKVEESGWEHEALVVGTEIMDHAYYWGPVLGLLGERDEDNWDWGAGIIFMCNKCLMPSIYHGEGHWRCRANGCYDGDHHIDPLDINAVSLMWHTSQRTMQWRAR